MSYGDVISLELKASSLIPQVPQERKLDSLLLSVTQCVFFFSETH